MTHLDLTKEQKEEARQTAQCPECKKAAKLLHSESTGKHELYCEDCHLSVPLWN